MTTSKPKAGQEGVTTGKPGRTSTYTPDLGHQICRRLLEGETLKAICQDKGMPSDSTVRVGYHTMADDIIDIADFHRQYSRNPSRCHRTTVSGLTMTTASSSDCFQR